MKASGVTISRPPPKSSSQAMMRPGSMRKAMGEAALISGPSAA